MRRRRTYKFMCVVYVCWPAVNVDNSIIRIAALVLSPFHLSWAQNAWLSSTQITPSFSLKDKKKYFCAIVWRARHPHPIDLYNILFAFIELWTEHEGQNNGLTYVVYPCHQILVGLLVEKLISFFVPFLHSSEFGSMEYVVCVCRHLCIMPLI